jgi:uncharacterized protein (DUF983 family)
MTRRERKHLNDDLRPQGKKSCSKCDEVKELTDFGKYKGVLYSMPTCKVCSRKRGLKYHSDKKNGVVVKITTKARNIELEKEGKKYCSKCDEVKSIDGFHKNSNTCKSCKLSYYHENKEIINSIHNEWKKKNSQHLLDYSKKYYSDNTDLIKEKVSIWRSNNTDKVKIYRNRDRNNHPKRFTEWLNKNKEHRKEWSRNYSKKRYDTDPDYRFSCLVMGHLRGVSNRKEFKDLWNDVKDVYNMYGISYHIDHRIPREWFKTTTEKSLINHIDNLQVIDSSYNLTKSNNWCDEVSNDYYQLIKGCIKDEYKDKVEVV